MLILKDISLLWASIHSLILFMILFESRYTKEKTHRLIAYTMLPLLAINFIILFHVGAATMGTLLLVTCSIPSLIFFWFLARYRDARFIFQFCLCDSIVFEIITLTSIVDFLLDGNYLIMFILRLIAYPLLEWFFYKKLRPLYAELQESLKTGWGFFAAIAAIFYVALALMSTYPTLITERPENLPALLLLCVLVPLIYGHIFNTLRRQKHMYEIMIQDNILLLQVANMKARVAEYISSDEKNRIERHNFRHKMNIIADLAENGQYSDLLTFIREYNDTLDEIPVKRYCQHILIDAILATYLSKAENKQIKIHARINFPDSLPVNEADLATAFANALENAIHACEKLPPSERLIEIKVLNSPQFMIQISNHFDGNITFNKDKLPVSTQDGHGFGTRSIIAFCKKNNAYYEFSTDNSTFYLRIIF